MSHEEYTAADFIAELNEVEETRQGLNNKIRSILLNDMSSILNSMNLGSPEHDELTISHQSTPNRFMISNKNYARTYRQGYLHSEEWFNGEGYIDSIKDLPARITYYPSGKVFITTWRYNNNVHRGDGKPAMITYYESGKIKQEVHVVKGRPSREGHTTAHIEYNEKGDITDEW